jgi:hypothetical protein
MASNHSALDRIAHSLAVAGAAREAVAAERSAWTSGAEKHLLALGGLCEELRQRAPHAPEVRIHINQEGCGGLPSICLTFGSTGPIATQAGPNEAESITNHASKALMQYEPDGRVVVNGLFGGLCDYRDEPYHREVICEMLPTEIDAGLLLRVLERFIAMAVRHDWPSAQVRARVAEGMGHETAEGER